MSEFLAVAQVKIEPSVVGFRKKLRDDVKAAIVSVGPRKVEIAPTLAKGFITSLQRQVKTAIKTSGVYRVTVVPQVTALRQMVAKELKDKPLEVPIKPTGAGGTGATEQAADATDELTEAEQRAAAIEKERKVIADNLTDSERLLTAAMKNGISETERSVLLAQAQAKARSGLLAVTLRQTIAEEGLFRAVQNRRAVGVLETGKGFESGIKDAAEREAAHGAAIVENAQREKKVRDDLAAANRVAEDNSKALAITNNDLAESERKVAAAIQSGIPAKELDTELSRQLSTVRKIEKATGAKLAEERQGTNRALADELSLTNQKAKAVAKSIQDTQSQITAARSLGVIQGKQNDIIKATAAATATDVKSLTTLAQIKTENSKLTAVETDLRALSKTATKLDSQALKEFVATKRAEIVVRKTALADQKAGIAQTGIETSRQRFALRGAAASALSFLKVRGATLAANSSFLAGAAAVAIFAKAVQSAAALETELNVFSVTAEATAGEMERVRDVALELGADISLPAVSAADAAAAFTNLAKAGLDVTDSVDGARGVLQLATAAQIENAEATELVASGLNAFGLAGTDATHVADLLTGAANAAQGSISDMGIALQQSSAVARQAGLSIEDTVAFITLLARNGIRGSDAGTSLRTSILRLIAPTEVANKQLQALGITVLDTAGKLRPEVFAELQQALAGLEPTARNQTLRKIFGQDAIRAAVIFGREGTAGLNAVRAATQEEGLAAELAGARTQGFAGQMEALKNSVATLGVSLGTLTIGPLTIFTKELNKGLTFINDTIAALQDLADVVKDIDIPPIDLDFEAGPIKVKAKKEGFNVGDAFRKSFELTVRGIKIGALIRFPIIREGIALGNVAKNLRQVKGDADETADAIQELFDKFREQGGGASSLHEVALGLVEMIAKLKGGDKEAQRLAKRLEAVLETLRATGGIPDIQIPVELLLIEPEFPAGLKAPPLEFDTPTMMDRSRRAHRDAGIAGLDVLKEILHPDVLTALGVDVFENLGKGMKSNVGAIREAVALGFDVQLELAEAAGASDSVILGILREKLAKRREFLAKQLARPQDKKQQGLTEQAAANVNETQRQIDAILDEQSSAARDQKSKAEAAADKIIDDRNKADAAVIAAFGRNEEDAENAVLIAESTAQVADDIKANTTLRGILRQQVKAAGEKIKGLEARRDFVRAAKKKILQLTLEINADNKAAAEALAAAAQERRETIRTSITLDIEFFGIVGNEKAEIRARRRLIQNLQKEIDAIKKQGKLTQEKKNRLKELRNQQARERAAIKDLQKEKEKSNDAMRALMFTFLQTQQGFAANLLGNLIPAGISGLNNVNGPSGAGGGALISKPVGGTGAQSFGGGLGGALIAEAGLAEAGKAKGPSSGQLGELIEVNRAMLAMLARIAGDAKHPEAKRSKMSSRAMLDMLGP